MPAVGEGDQLSRPCAHRVPIGAQFVKPFVAVSRTNGKAEHFIQTLLCSSLPVEHLPQPAALVGWLRWYNRRRPYGSLGGRPPLSRVSHVCGQYT